ncbi:MAG: B12-binding domain-containing radical SAM protein [Emcibacteraceae bacterium]|nr:B12-binding domain-containing radical SAM protein [Emcibacteraceae bacterium]
MNRKLKVLFINFPTFTPAGVESCFKTTPSPYLMQVPLGIAHLASVLETKEFIESVECIDYCAELENGPAYGSYENFIATLASKITYTPDILAYSMNFSTQHDFFIRCEKQLKPMWPHSITIAGGTHATNITRELFQGSSLDYVVRGEAENSLAQLLNLISNDEADKASSIQGVYFKDSISNEKTLKISEYPDLDTLPAPCWHMFDMPRYTEKYSETFVHAERRKSCSIMTSRGCPFHCTFCSSFTLHGRKMRYFGVEWTKKVTTQLYEEYGVTEFIIQDDMFTVHRERTIEMLTELQKLSIPDLALSVKNALSINTLDESVIDALAATGLETAYLAVESGSEHVNHNIMKKRVKLDRVPGIIRMFRERNVPTCCFFIMGFPGETKEMMEEGIKFAESINSDWCTFNAVKPLVGTPLYDEMLAENYIDHTPEFWAQTAYGLREFDTKEIAKDELNTLLYDANIRINFLNNYNVRSGNYTVATNMFKNIVEDYPYHIIGWYMLHICSKKTGDEEQSREYLKKIKMLLETDERASSMFLQYEKNLPDLDSLNANLLQGAADYRVNASTSISQQLNSTVDAEPA